MFASGAPLNGLVAVAGLGNVSLTTTADTAKDDRFDENGTDPSAPDVSGVSSGIINLAYGSMPVNSSPTASTGENGYESFMDDVADSSGIMTIDFGFEVLSGQPNAAHMQRNLAGSSSASTSSEPATFNAWQSQNTLGGLNNPDDDPDADGLTNLMEYALGTSPDNGLGVSRVSLESNTTSGAIDAWVTRPAGEHRDLRYILEGSHDLATWSALSITPVVNANADQTETLRFSQVESAFNGAAHGFLRLKVMLDADLDGNPEAGAISGVQGWTRRLFPVGRQSLSMPLLQPAVYTGQVSSISGRNVTINTHGLDIRTQLPNGVSCYAEVIDGALSGSTYDIDTSNSSGSTLALVSSADSGMTGARIRVRPHWTLGSLLPVSGLQPAAVADDADRILFFDSATSQFQINWLHAATSASQWVREGDGALTDDAARVIPPQAGMLVQIRSTPATLTFLGEVRTAPLTLPQAAGTHLLGTGFALPKSPGSQPFTIGSRLRLWSGDTDASSAAYQNYLLNPQSRWIDEATGLDVTTQPLLDAFRAFFLVKP
jgi:hypothetical protein